MACSPSVSVSYIITPPHPEVSPADTPLAAANSADAKPSAVRTTDAPLTTLADVHPSPPFPSARQQHRRRYQDYQQQGNNSSIDNSNRNRSNTNSSVKTTATSSTITAAAATHSVSPSQVPTTAAARPTPLTRSTAFPPRRPHASCRPCLQRHPTPDGVLEIDLHKLGTGEKCAVSL